MTSLIHICLKLNSYFFLDDVYSAGFLLNHGAKVNVKREFDDNTPLHLAAQHPDMNNIAEILLNKEAHINSANMDGL